MSSLARLGHFMLLIENVKSLDSHKAKHGHLEK